MNESPTPSAARDCKASNGEKRETLGHALRIVVAGDPSALAFYREALPALGHEISVADSGPHLVEQCRLLRPDLVIADVQLPRMDGVAAADELCRVRPTPVVLISNSFEPLWVARALNNECIVACLPRSLDGPTLGAALAFAARQFAWFAALRGELASAQQALEDRKIIERAKGLLVRYLGIAEEEAFRRLRKHASDGNRKLADVGREILASAKVFADLEHSDGAAGSRNGHSNSTHSALHRRS